MSIRRHNSDAGRAPISDVTFDSPRIKILTLGDVGVGKSCLVKYYCEGRFVSKYIPTIGIDYGVKKVPIQSDLLERIRRALPTQESTRSSPSKTAATTTTVTNSPPFVHVNFWDVAGGSESLEVRNEFYEATQGIILMYDVRNPSSFDALDLWWDEVGAYISLPTHESSEANHSSHTSEALARRSTHANHTGSSSSSSSNYSDNHTRVEGRGNVQEAALRVRRHTSTTASTAAGKLVGTNQGRAPVVIVCATKVDDVLATGDGGSAESHERGTYVGGRAVQRAVTEEQGRSWALTHGCAAYYETSASSGLNVNTALDSLIYNVVATFM